MTECINALNRVVWGIPALILILGVGVYLSIRTRFIQFKLFPASMKAFLNQCKTKSAKNDAVTPRKALFTALAATVGTGNLVGVAGAIALGGPGAVFWMWICAILGMATKFAEATLAVHYRSRNSDGEFVGGPMYIIQNGLGCRWIWLAGIYSFFGVVAAFGVGNATQINSALNGINSVISYLGGSVTRMSNLLVGAVFALLILLILSGGAKRIGSLAECLVPFVSVAYLILCAGIILMKLPMLPKVLTTILQGAFSPEAVTGGVLGSAFQAMRIGASRGVFTNEAGMGTASIAHAAAQVNHPVEQGMMGIVEVFLDTILICTMTAFAILCSGVPIPYGIDTGAALTTNAFAQIYGSWVSIPIALALCCFAVATVLGWGLYGMRCAQFLFGQSVCKFFVFAQAGVVMLAAALETSTIWALSEAVNGLMAIPNLIALFLLCPKLTSLIKRYEDKTSLGGTYENFKKCTDMEIVSHPQVPSTICKGEGKRKKDFPSEYWSA